MLVIKQPINQKYEKEKNITTKTKMNIEKNNIIYIAKQHCLIGTLAVGKIFEKKGSFFP